MDLTALSVAELERLRDELFAELEKRYALATAEERVADLNRAHLTARGIKPGGPWTQPATPAEGYPPGWEVAEGWVSDIPANMNPPGGPGWSRIPERGQQ